MTQFLDTAKQETLTMQAQMTKMHDEDALKIEQLKKEINNLQQTAIHRAQEQLQKSYSALVDQNNKVKEKNVILEAEISNQKVQNLQL